MAPERFFENRKSGEALKMKGLEKKEKPPFDSIVIISYGSSHYPGVGRKSKIDPEFGLTYESKMAAIAGLEAFKIGLGEKIVLVGERTTLKKISEEWNPAVSQEHTTPEFMKEFLVSKGIPEDKIEIYTPYDTTFSQAKETGQLQHEGKIKKALVISLGFHDWRVKKNFELHASNVPREFITAEELLLKRDRRYKPIIEEWVNSPDMQRVARQEKLLLRILTYLDFKGLLQEYIAKKRGVHAPLTSFPKQKPTK